MSISRTEVERRRDQAQRDRANMALIANDCQDDFFPPTESLFQPPSEVPEDNLADENDDTARKFERILGPWRSYNWEFGNPIRKNQDQSLDYGKSSSPSKVSPRSSSSHPPRVNGDHKHQSSSRSSSQPRESNQSNHAQVGNSHHGNDNSSYRADNKSGMQKRTSSSGASSVPRATSSNNTQKNVRPAVQSQSRSTSQSSSQSVPPQTVLPAKKSPVVPSHERESRPRSKDHTGSTKPGSDHHGSYRSSNMGRSQLPEVHSGVSRGPSTPPFPPPSHSHHTPHQTPPPLNHIPVPSHRTPPPHRTPPLHRISPHRTPPPQRTPPPTLPAANVGRGIERKPNLFVDIKKEKKPGDLDDIFKEMELSTPVTALSETPVKCNFKFGIIKSEDDDDLKLKPPISPLPEAEPPKVNQEPAKESSSLDLELSDDSDGELDEKPDIAANKKSPTSEKAADSKREDSHSSSGESSSDSDSSSGSDSESSSSGSGDENEEAEDTKKEETSGRAEKPQSVPAADARDQKPRGGPWGLSQYIKKQPSPVSLLRTQATTSNDVSHNSKMSSDEDISKVTKASPRKMADIGSCNTVPFHDDPDPISRNNDNRSVVSPDTMSTSSHASSLSGKRGGCRRDSASDAAPSTKASNTATKTGSGIKSGPGRPKSVSVSGTKVVDSGNSTEITATPASTGNVDTSKTPSQRKRRRTSSSGGGGRKVAKASSPAASSSSEVDIESMTPPETALAKPSFAVQDPLGGGSGGGSGGDSGGGGGVSDVRKHHVTKSSPATSGTVLEDSKKSTAPPPAAKASTPNRRESHYTKKATKKNASSVSQVGWESLNGSKPNAVSKASKCALTDIGSIMKDISVPQLLSPTIPAYSGEPGQQQSLKAEPEPQHIPTLTCGKPSIVVRLRTDRLCRAPWPKGGKLSKTKMGSGATTTAATPTGHKGASFSVDTCKTASNVKSGGGGGSNDGKKKSGDSIVPAESSSSLPRSSTASPSTASFLPAKRKTDRDHPSSAKKQKAGHSATKPSSANTPMQPEINGVAHPGEGTVKKVGGKRVAERRESTSSSGSRSSYKSVSKKYKDDMHSERDSDKPAGVGEMKMNGKDNSLPFNSYSQPSMQASHSSPHSSPHLPSSKPVTTTSAGTSSMDGSDTDPLALAEHKLESPDFYMDKAKKLKHSADKIPEKKYKLLPYLKSVLYFIMWGHAYEKQQQSASLLDPKQAASIFKATLSLQMDVRRIRLSLPPDTIPVEKDWKLTVLSLRIQSLLALKLYNFSRAEVNKLKRILDSEQSKEQTKEQSKGSAMKVSAPSPHQNHWNKNSTGTPSPMSPTPSPACSIGSMESQGSYEVSGGKMTNGSQGSNTMTSPGMVAVPQRVHSVTQTYLSYMDKLRVCHEFWEQSDVEFRAHKHAISDFFKSLDNRHGPLSLHSSMIHLVTYVSAALKELNLNS